MGSTNAKFSGKALLAGLLFLLLGVALTYFGTTEILPELKLRASNRIIEAEVVDTRITNHWHSPISYDVRYRFKLPGSDKVYTHDQPSIGGVDLYTSLATRELLQRASDTGRVMVVYVPENASINRPVNEPHTLRDSVIGLAGGLVCGVAGLVTVIVQLRRRRATHSIVLG